MDAATQPSRQWTMWLGVVFALGWPLLLAAAIPYQNLHNRRQDWIVLACEWASLLVLYAIVVGLERRPFFSTSGWHRPKRADWIIIAFLAAVTAALCLWLSKQHATAPGHGSILAEISGVPLAMRAALVFTAGICEETLFRGYAIERLKLLTGNIWLGGLIAAALFTLAHIPRYGLSIGLLGVAGIAVLLTSIYIWRRNVAPCIVLHWLIDGFALLIVPAFVTMR